MPAKSEDPPPRPNLVKKARPKSGKTLAIDELWIHSAKDGKIQKQWTYQRRSLPAKTEST